MDTRASLLAFVSFTLLASGCPGITVPAPPGTDSGQETTGDACTPNCGGRECGDDGCGGSCGTCPAAAPTCSAAGVCQASCVPNCGGNTECGDDGCGGSCGACPAAAPICNSQRQCVASCTPDCAGRECGDDGCGDSCGTCPAAAPECDAAGQCQVACTPNCVGSECGPDGCGGQCGSCAAGQVCDNGLCEDQVAGCDTVDLNFIDVYDPTDDLLAGIDAGCGDGACFAGFVDPLLSTTCADCVGDRFACTLNNCFNQCIADFASAGCTGCRAEFCDFSFGVCSGITGCQADCFPEDECGSDGCAWMCGLCDFGAVCSDFACAEHDCSDGADNDGDGFTDCNDFDCDPAPECAN